VHCARRRPLRERDHHEYDAYKGEVCAHVVRSLQFPPLIDEFLGLVLVKLLDFSIDRQVENFAACARHPPHDQPRREPPMIEAECDPVDDAGDGCNNRDRKRGGRPGRAVFQSGVKEGYI
jgi:hypothetical protein